MSALVPVPDRAPDDEFGQLDPHDLAAEMAALGSMMLSAAAAETCMSALSADDFFRAAHQVIFRHVTAMMRAAVPVDALTVKDRIEAAGEMRALAANGGALYLHTLIAAVPVTANAPEYVRIIREHAVRRRLLQSARRILQWANSTAEDAHGLTERALREMEAVRDSGSGDGITALTFDEFLDAGDEDDEYDWIIPGLLERGDRLVLTGAEGAGKSSLLRQLAVCIAAGIHPFTQVAMEPRRVLLIDGENGAKHMRRKLRPMRSQARLQQCPVKESNLWLEARPGGMDLARDKDVSWLLRQVAAIRPDIVILGPLYKLAPRALNDDSDIAPVLAVLDMIRARDACLILEAHAGHALGPGGRRDFRPRGSSALLGWPEFGYGLRWSDAPIGKVSRTVDMVSWRGDRDERDWPEMLTAGGVWPWEIYNPPSAPASGGNYWEGA